MHYLFTFVLAILLGTSACRNNKLPVSAEQIPLKLWYEQPADHWTQALPVGNGSLGGMVFGNTDIERIQLNEETIWTGEKKYDRDKKEGHKHLSEIRRLLFEGKYLEAEKMAEDKLLAERLPSGTHTYQTLGNIYIDFDDNAEVTNYRRELDLNSAIATVLYTRNGTNFRHEVFSSFPGQAIVMKVSSDQKGKISFRLNFERTNKTEIDITEDGIKFSEHVGNGYGVKLEGRIKLATKGGTVFKEGNKTVRVLGANEITIYIVAASDYRGDNPGDICRQRLNAIRGISYGKLLKSHIKDYRSLFDRVVFNISNSDGEDMPTDERLARVVDGDEDPYLTELHYQYGRYLLISSSRPGCMPANLQGIWADGFTPPWNSDYHININLQMNYWLSEITNLSECHDPLLYFIGNLREMGRITAKETYGCRGFVAHHTTDPWFVTSCFGQAQYGMWPMGAAWACQHLFTRYEFTEDREWLRNYAYPVMKEAALFFTDFLVKSPNTGKLVSGPSISPENTFFTDDGGRASLNMGPTMDRSIIIELFNNCIRASEILETDDDFRQVLKAKRDSIPPLQIDSNGRLMEWAEDFSECEPGHRHISHLYALHPSNLITKQKTPELFEAAKKTIGYRLSNGGGHTGWSRAWIINFQARLQEPDKAYQNILALQRYSTLPNLFDTHPPFQIDGNFGVVSGITEMLMQSHAEEVHVLPSLPSQWENGSICGIVARGGFLVDIEWEGGKVQKILVESRLGNNLKLRHRDKTVSIPTSKGMILKFDGELNRI